MDSVGLCPQAQISTFHMAVWLQGESQGLYFKDRFNISLQRKRVWSGKTFESRLLCGQGNVNDCLAACHRHRIGPHGFPSFWWLWQCRLPERSLLPSKLSSLFDISIPGLSRIHSHTNVVLIRIHLCHCPWLLYLLYESVSDLPRRWKRLKNLNFSNTVKLPRDCLCLWLDSPSGHCLHLHSLADAPHPHPRVLNYWMKKKLGKLPLVGLISYMTNSKFLTNGNNFYFLVNYLSSKDWWLLNDAKTVAIVNGDSEKVFHKWPNLDFNLKMVLINQTMCKLRSQGCGFCFSILPVWLLPQPGQIQSSERQAIHMNTSPVGLNGVFVECGRQASSPMELAGKGWHRKKGGHACFSARAQW